MDAVILVAILLLAWGVFVAREMRLALRATEPELRLRRARRLLLYVTLGVPLVLALLVVA